jgi:hypothetical protein
MENFERYTDQRIPLVSDKLYIRVQCFWLFQKIQYASSDFGLALKS